jgi:hypothetical protein
MPLRVSMNSLLPKISTEYQSNYWSKKRQSNYLITQPATGFQTQTLLFERKKPKPYLYKYEACSQ